VRKTKDGKKWKVVFYRGSGDGKSHFPILTFILVNIFCLLSAEPKSGKREVQYFDFVSASSGQHQTPFVPTHEEPWKDYKGEITHSHYYKYPTPDMAQKSVVIVGGAQQITFRRYLIVNLTTRR